MTTFDTLLTASKPYLTDGGMETWLFFQQGFEAPEFAAITLMDEERAKAALRSYFDEFLALACAAGTGFVLDTNTWRGCLAWADKLGMGRDDLLEMSWTAANFAKGIRAQWLDRVPDILVNGVIGPAGDGYSSAGAPTAREAQRLHAPQIGALASAGVDMFSAITMTNVAEAIGIARAVADHDLPVVISFTVETDGRLPSGDLLGEAIEAVDAACGKSPAYYMINCAHPDHIRTALAGGEA